MLGEFLEDKLVLYTWELPFKILVVGVEIRIIEASHKYLAVSYQIFLLFYITYCYYSRSIGMISLSFSGEGIPTQTDCIDY